MDLNHIAIIIVFLPLLSALLVGLNTSRINVLFSQIFTVGSVLVTAALSWILFYKINGGNTPIHLKLMNWFASDILSADWSIYVDSLTATMFVVVSSVSCLVHLYSIGYMSHDNSRQRFMSYLSLFTFFMLILVSADNFVQLFVGWEGVGLSSYLLIGFWYHKKPAYLAAMKAFLVNRVGDIGLALGIFLIACKFGSLDYLIVFQSVPYMLDNSFQFLGIEVNTLTLICILLFIGCMGKSAQIGLHTWLPDAMEGPTPVSALIHAATMVTAGVFLLARCSYLFEYSETALTLVTMIGGGTCLFAATIAMAQNDIKKIIAYSTCSQLGYMVFACGVSAYSAGMFHLLTHAFFKALLFLGAGSVIHGLSDEQNIKAMGGIWKKMPWTYGLMLIGSVALAGFPPLSGFFSKDAILEAAYASGTFSGQLAYFLGITAAFLTAFYSFRLLFFVFHGKTKLSKTSFNNIHEAPASMMIPLIALAIGSIFTGIVAEKYFHIVGANNHFWHSAIFVLSSSHKSMHQIETLDLWVRVLPLIAGLIGLLTALIIYIPSQKLHSIVKKALKPILILLENKWYFDEIYDAIFVKNARKISMLIWKKFDVGVIDNIPTSLVASIAELSRKTSSLQTGYVYHYVMAMMIGFLVLIYCYLPW